MQSINFALPQKSNSLRQTWRRNQNTVKYRNPVTLGPVSHTILIAIMLAVLGLIYLTQITKTSTYGYQKDALETKLTQLESENRDLEVEAAKLQALERVEHSGVAKALTAPDATGYARGN